jgi:hypothetical protein
MPDPVKEVQLFDASSNPLKVKAIRIELFDAITCFLLAVGNSDNLTPAVGSASINWGARLSFKASANPLDIYVTDKNYRYPGNTVRYLNGKTEDRIDIDLLALPTTPSGHSSSPLIATPSRLSRWVEDAPLWTDGEKRAVRNLIFNYMTVIVARRAENPDPPADFRDMATNWEEALRRVGIDPDTLRR